MILFLLTIEIDNDLSVWRLFLSLPGALEIRQRIAVSGYDPLIPPSEAKPLTKVKEIKVSASTESDDSYNFTCDWNLHRLCQPII